MKLGDLSDEELVANLHALVGRTRTVLAYLLEYLGEVEERPRFEIGVLVDVRVLRAEARDDRARRDPPHGVASPSRAPRREEPRGAPARSRGQDEDAGAGAHRGALSAARCAFESRSAAGGAWRADAGGPIVPARTARAGAVQGAVHRERGAPREDRACSGSDASPEPERRSRHRDGACRRSLDAELEKQRLGKTERAPKKAARKKTRPGYVPRAVRRAVFARDGEQCTFVDDEGRRCEARTFLELDHRKPRALGGTDDIENLCVKCRRHNALAAERAFGREHIEKKIRERSHPRQRAYGSDTALRALVGMGFKEQEARRALTAVIERFAGSEPPLETVLREALSMLT